LPKTDGSAHGLIGSHMLFLLSLLISAKLLADRSPLVFILAHFPSRGLPTYM